MANVCGTTGFVVNEAGAAISPRVKCSDYDFDAQAPKSEAPDLVSAPNRQIIATLPEGVVERDVTGQWYLNGIAIDPAISTFQDVIARALAEDESDGGAAASAAADRAQRAFEFDETMRVRAEEGNREFKQGVKEHNDRIAIDEELLAFNQRKELRAIEEGNKTRELQAQVLIESITARIERTKTERQGLIQAAQQFNADLQFEVNRENARRRTENIALQQQNAAALAEAQQNPSDTAKVVSLLTSRANAAAGLRAAAERGESGITDQSLLPAQELIDIETELAAGPAIVPFNPIDIPEFTPLDTNIPSVSDITGGDIDADLFAAATENGAAVKEPDGTIKTPEGFTGSVAEGSGLTQEQADALFGELGMAKGGKGLFLEPTTLKVAENGPELIQGQPLNGTAATATAPTIAPSRAQLPIATAPAPVATRGALATANAAPAPDAAAGFDFGVYGDLQGLIAATTAEVQAGGPGPAAALMEKYTAFVSGGGTPADPPVTPGTPPVDDARKRQEELVKKLLDDLGLSNVLEAFPIRASAPGTTRFQQRAFQSVFTAAGFGDEELFNEILNRNRAQGVRVGALGRSG